MLTDYLRIHKQSLLIVIQIFALTLTSSVIAELKPNQNQSVPDFPSCPDSPNCVSSLSNDSEHRVQALMYQNVSASQAMSVLLQVLTEMTSPVRQLTENQYYHAEFKSKVFGFVDDVYCLLNAEKSQIDIYSASRTGYHDLGVNRKRVEQIRKQFNQKLEQITSKN